MNDENTIIEAANWIKANPKEFEWIKNNIEEFKDNFSKYIREKLKDGQIKLVHASTGAWQSGISNKALCGAIADFKEDCTEKDWLVNCSDCLNTNSSL